jgi:hypothetical protein
MSFGAIDARASLGAGGSLVIEAYSGNSYNFKGAGTLIRLVKKMKIVTLPILWEQALQNSKVCSDDMMEQLHLKPDQEVVMAK